MRVVSVDGIPLPVTAEPTDGPTDLDLLVAATNQAIEKSKEVAAERMQGVTGGLSGMLPGGLGGLFG